MLRIPLIWIMIFAVVICAISLSFFDPTLADHLKSFNLSTTMVGLVFLLEGGVYTISAPLLGWVVDKFECSSFLMIFGSMTTVVSMLFVGPSPLFGMDKNLIVISVCCFLYYLLTHLFRLLCLFSVLQRPPFTSPPSKTA